MHGDPLTLKVTASCLDLAKNLGSYREPVYPTDIVIVLTLALGKCLVKHTSLLFLAALAQGIHYLYPGEVIKPPGVMLV